MEKPDFSRNPEDYHPEPDGHFTDAKRRRDFPPTAIRKAIESGEPTFQENGRIKLTTEYIGWTFHVIVDPERNYAITCYPDDERWYK